MSRKRIAVLVVFLGCVLALGITFGRSYSMKRKTRSAHTIVYRITSFNPDGSVRETSQLIRSRSANGTWKSRQTFPNGKSKDARGESAPAERDWNEFAKGLRQESLLGFRIVIQPTEKGEVWLSPELDDVLKLVYYFDAEKKELESVMEAIQIDDRDPSPLEG